MRKWSWMFAVCCELFIWKLGVVSPPGRKCAVASHQREVGAYQKRRLPQWNDGERAIRSDGIKSHRCGFDSAQGDESWKSRSNQDSRARSDSDEVRQIDSSISSIKASYRHLPPLKLFRKILWKSHKIHFQYHQHSPILRGNSNTTLWFPSNHWHISVHAV